MSGLRGRRNPLAMKTVFAPHLNRNVTFGRRRPVAHSPHMSLSRYIKALPPPPSAVDYTKAAMPALANIFGNDTLGDCVIAGGYHFEAVTTGNAGQLYTATLPQIIKDYSAIGGYVPGNPATDNGCDLQTAMNYWMTHGFSNGTKLAGWLSVDPTNMVEIQTAMWLFEGLYFGLDLPDSWISPFPSANGFTWGPGTPDPFNGHCIVGVGYNAVGVVIDTWGLLGTLTWSAVQQQCAASNGGELYLMLTPDMISKATKKAPTGFDWATLNSDFQALGGSPPVTPPAPAPTPPTPPAPTPPSPPAPPAPTPPAPHTVVTLAQAQAWAAAGLAKNWPTN